MKREADGSQDERQEESIAPNNGIEPNSCQRQSWRTGCLDDQPAKEFFAPTHIPCLFFLLILSLSPVSVVPTL